MCQNLKNFDMDTERILKNQFAPVLVIAFNRVDATRSVIDALIESGVKVIYFAVDGPRSSVITDALRVSEVKALESEYRDSIKFITHTQQGNLGCRLAVTEAISWFLSQVDFGIILEDDCVPSSGFLTFATRMLHLYRDDESIMHVGGSSYLDANVEYAYNHYYSSFHEVWGWATWSRAWKSFQLDPGEPSEEEDELIVEHFKSKKIAKWFTGYLIQARGVEPSVWSTQWSLSIIKNHGIAVNPINNLVKNIGFGVDSTHGSSETFSLYDNFHVSALSLLPDPPIIDINYNFDKKRFDAIRKTDPSLFIKNRLKAWIRAFFIRNLPQSVIQFIRIKKSYFKRLT
jgi:hypothetical protein